MLQTSIQFKNRKSHSEKLLGVIIDNKLSFEEHIETLRGKARSKRSALFRVAPFMNVNKRRLLKKAFFDAQFTSYLWCGCFIVQLNNKINRSYERCLRVTYEDHKASFEELLEMDKSVLVHYKDLQCLAIELYKVFNEISRYNERCISIKHICQL